MLYVLSNQYQGPTHKKSIGCYTAKRPASQKMSMKMLHFLAAFLATIYNKAVTPFINIMLPGKLFAYQGQAPHKIPVFRSDII